MRFLTPSVLWTTLFAQIKRFMSSKEDFYQFFSFFFWLHFCNKAVYFPLVPNSFLFFPRDDSNGRPSTISVGCRKSIVDTLRTISTGLGHSQSFLTPRPPSIPPSRAPRGPWTRVSRRNAGGHDKFKHVRPTFRDIFHRGVPWRGACANDVGSLDNTLLESCNLPLPSSVFTVRSGTFRRTRAGNNILLIFLFFFHQITETSSRCTAHVFSPSFWADSLWGKTAKTPTALCYM